MAGHGARPPFLPFVVSAAKDRRRGDTARLHLTRRTHRYRRSDTAESLTGYSGLRADASALRAEAGWAGESNGEGKTAEPVQLRVAHSSAKEFVMSFNVVAAIIAVMLATSPANAQEQHHSAGETRYGLRRGDRIRIIDAKGGIVDGRFEEMSTASLRVVRKGTVLDLPRANINQIQRVHHESDGILVGLGVGAAAGLGYVALQCSGSSESGDCRRAGSLVMIGPSALAGALIDRALKKFDIVFDRGASSARQIRIAPILQKHRQGIAVTLVVE